MDIEDILGFINDEYLSKYNENSEVITIENNNPLLEMLQ